MRKTLRFVIFASLVCIVSYGAIRLYYRVNAGFVMENIISDHPYDERWQTRALSFEEKNNLRQIFSQKFNYLGKGCQAYVFLSDDGQYVLKFFKYQRFRPRPYINFLTWIPAVERYRVHKIEEKTKRLHKVFSSWKIAFDNLQPETGLIYVHLNKSNDLQQKVVFYDKMGFEHTVDLDQMEFLVQKKADMLCSSIEKLMKSGDVAEAKVLISRILTMLISEYQRGFGDNDHALMQNTGVFERYPIHIDVGQFVQNENLKNPDIYRQEIFSKTYRFRIWLKKYYPELVVDLEKSLIEIIGPDFYKMKPKLKNISHSRWEWLK